MKNLLSAKKSILSFLVLSFCSVYVFSTTLSPPRQRFISYALSFVDTPYVWGGDAPGGFDCSGFVSYVGEKSLNDRVDFPRTAADIYAKFHHIDKEEREPGDLVFFRDTPWTRIFHVGIYCGVYHGPQKKFEGKRVFMSAISKNREGVKLSLIDEGYWEKYNIVYARFLKSSADYFKQAPKNSKQAATARTVSSTQSKAVPPQTSKRKTPSPKR